MLILHSLLTELKEEFSQSRKGEERSVWFIHTLLAIILPFTSSKTSSLLRALRTLFGFADISWKRYYTFMGSPKIPWDRLWPRIWKMIPEPETNGRLIVALDDYINPKTGKKIFACSKVFDHAAKQNQSKYPWAQNIVAVGLLKMVKGRWACLPLSQRYYFQAKDIKNYKPTYRSQPVAFQKKHKQAVDMLSVIAVQFPESRILVVSDSWFGNKSLERGSRSERALKLALAEMYVQGVSTRKVAKITEELCGFEVSSSEVSRASAALDTQLQSWRKRPLGECAYVYLDARYEKIRHSGVIIDCAVLLAVGITPSGHREVIGVSVKLSEQEVHWRDFISSLKDRGLHGVQLFISDAHEGLKAARKAIFPTVPWQRCQFHLQQNAQSYVPKRSMKQEVSNRIRAIFTASNDQEALRLLELFVTQYKDSAPELSAWAEKALPEGMVVFSMPEQHWRKIRTDNMLERLNKEILRRTRVATLFPSTASCMRLVSAVVMEISDEWETGRRYLNME
jgi:putative transposase